MNDPLFLLIKDGHCWRRFENPSEVFIVKSTEDIQKTLKKIDSLILTGKYIAGFVSYEASTGFDNALETKMLTDFPYAVFGVFENYKLINSLPNQQEVSGFYEWQPSQSKSLYNSNIDKIKSYIVPAPSFRVAKYRISICN